MWLKFLVNSKSYPKLKKYQDCLKLSKYQSLTFNLLFRKYSDIVHFLGSQSWNIFSEFCRDFFSLNIFKVTFCPFDLTLSTSNWPPAFGPFLYYLVTWCDYVICMWQNLLDDSDLTIIFIWQSFQENLSQKLMWKS